MLGFMGSLRVFLSTEPVDLRKSYNGLYDLTVNHLNEDPCSGALFVFTNKRRSLIKILYWDGTGIWILMKRLEKGTFSWPKGGEGGSEVKLSLAPEALYLLLNGIDMKEGKMRPWYQR